MVTLARVEHNILSLSLPVFFPHLISRLNYYGLPN